MKKSLSIPLMITIAAIAAFWIVSSTLTSVIVFIPGVIITFIIYLNTFYRKVPNPDSILPLYLLALGIQFIHFTEEYLTDFNVEIARIIGQDAYPMDYWVTFNMVAYFFFIIGGIILFRKIKELMIIPLFFIVVGVILNAVGHIILSIYVGGYFSGLYSALLYVVIGPILIKRLLEETKMLNTE